jgi:oxalate decarboxylase/phosphoglucose isomerase-like protein (cupin superfamily)
VVAEADIQFLDLGEARREDERGLVYFPFQDLPEGWPREEMCRSCHLVSIAPGQCRGQHQHPDKTEWLYVFHGQGQLFWRGQDDRRQQRPLGGNRTLVVIPPGMPHTLHNDGPDPIYLLAWRAGRQSGREGPDTRPDPLI